MHSPCAVCSWSSNTKLAHCLKQLLTMAIVWQLWLALVEPSAAYEAWCMECCGLLVIPACSPYLASSPLPCDCCCHTADVCCACACCSSLAGCKDACLMLHRLPWRVAMWYKQTGDERVLPLIQAQQKFFEGQNFISAGYSLDGKPRHKYTNICFLAPILILFKVSLWCLLLAAWLHQLPWCRQLCFTVSALTQKTTGKCEVTSCELQIMGGKKKKEIQDALDKERKEGRATYFGETIELVSDLQLQELCKPSNLPRRSKGA